MNILCISPDFVPLGDSEAYCGAKMAMALQDGGANVTVLSMALAHLPPWKRKRLDDSNLWQKVYEITIPVRVPSTHRSIKSLWLGGKYQTVNFVRWVDAVVKLGQEINSKNPFDIVYSRSTPNIAAIAGYWVSKLMGIPWVANINDPWDYMFFPNVEIKKVSRVRTAFSMYWLKKTLKYADLITYPSSRLRDYVSRLGGEEPWGEVIPHIGYTCSDQKSADDFHLVHAGKIGLNEITGRSTHGLLQGLASFFKVEEAARSVTKFTFMGPKDDATEALGKNLDLDGVGGLLGSANYEESLRHIRSATVCVLVEADGAEGIYLPSKLADYVVAKKPTLALSPSVGVLSDMVPDGGIIRVSPNDEISISEAIGKLYKG